MTIVLAADLGGTSVKAALVTSEGHILAQTAVPAPEPGVSGLILPPEWWNCFREAAATLKRDDEAAFRATDAIAITGVTRTPVVLDAVGNSLAGAITARDARAQEIAARTAIDPRELSRSRALRRVPSGGAAEMDQPADAAGDRACARGRRSEGLHRVAAHRAHRERSDFAGAADRGGKLDRRSVPALAARPAGRPRAGSAAARQRDRSRARRTRANRSMRSPESPW